MNDAERDLGKAVLFSGAAIAALVVFGKLSLYFLRRQP